jgi:hypothetical protein
MRSKSVSQSSPETGDARPEDAARVKPGDDAAAGAGAGPDSAAKAKGEARDGKGKGKGNGNAKTGRSADEAPARGPGPLQIELEMSRNRFIGWTVFGLVFGALLWWKLGTVGQCVGIVLMVLGALRGWQLLQTFLHAPGTIVVTDDEVTLPRGLCLPRPVTVKPRDVTAVYFLRRSVPWNRSAPVLVVELGPKAMAFPRDWFASEADQRHIVHALMRVRGGGAEPAVSAAPAAAPAGETAESAS